MPLKIFDESRELTGAESLEYATKALNYAIEKGAKISSHSYGNRPGPYSIHFSHFGHILVNNKNHILIAAAGNDRNSNDDVPAFPCNIGTSTTGTGTVKNTICVAASNHDNKPYYYTNHGRESVHVFAPGQDISSLWANGAEPKYCLKSNNCLDRDGTSYAAPHVAGLAALILSIQPTLEGKDVKKFIEDNVDTAPHFYQWTSTGGLINVGKTLKDVIEKFPASATEIASPNYPNTYPNNVDETWPITAPSGSIVKLQFQSFYVSNFLFYNDWD